MNLSRGGTRGIVTPGATVVVADRVVDECPQPDTTNTAATAATSACPDVSQSQRCRRDRGAPALRSRRPDGRWEGRTSVRSDATAHTSTRVDGCGLRLTRDQ